MNRKSSTARGYVLVMTMLLLTFATVLVSLLVARGQIFVPFMRSSVQRGTDTCAQTMIPLQA